MNIQSIRNVVCQGIDTLFNPNAQEDKQVNLGTKLTWAGIAGIVGVVALGVLLVATGGATAALVISPLLIAGLFVSIDVKSVGDKLKYFSQKIASDATKLTTKNNDEENQQGSYTPRWKEYTAGTILLNPVGSFLLRQLNIR